MGFMMRRVSVLDSRNTSTATTTSATRMGAIMLPKNANRLSRVSERRTTLPSCNFTAAYTVSVLRVSE